MSVRNFTEPKALQREMRILAFSIPTNGSSAMVATSQHGVGAVIARTGVGTVTVTLSSGLNFTNLLFSSATIRLATTPTNDATNLNFRVLTWVASTRVLTLQCIQGTGAAAELPTANANNVAEVLMVFSDTAAKPSLG